MKVLTLGGKGFIGSHLPYKPIPERIYANSEHLDCLLGQWSPDVLVNCVGTGHNVDWCEEHREETSLTYAVIPVLLAIACARMGIHLVQIGSGCVFDGEEWYSEPDGLWREIDHANPKSYYSKAKYACDLVIGEMSNVTILRVRMPISSRHHSRNLIDKLIKYERVVDADNSVTFMDDLIRAVDWVIQKHLTGIYHVVNPGGISPAKIMDEYHKYVPTHNFERISVDQLDKIAMAPRSNTILSCEKIVEAGFVPRDSEDALRETMKQYCTRSLSRS